MKFERCIMCEKQFIKGINVFTPAGEAETQISGYCETCFDMLFADKEEDVLAHTESADEVLARATPKTLLDACIDIVQTEAHASPEHARAIVKDFLSQRFGASLLGAQNEREEQLLRDLWLAITGEKLP